MKKVLLSLIAVVLAVGITYSQTSPGKFVQINGSPSLIVYKMNPVSPWPSDSSVTYYTGNFSIADGDSVAGAVATTVSTHTSNKVNFKAVLQVSADGKPFTDVAQTSAFSSANSFANVGTLIDTTETKTAVFAISSLGNRVATKGMAVARLSLVPTVSPASASVNGTKSIVEIWVTIVKRLYPGANTQQ